MKKKALQILFATLLIDTIGIGMIIPIIPIIFTDPSSPSFLLEEFSQKGRYLAAGSIAGLFGLMQFIAAPIFGELSDIFGRKRLLTLGVGVLALSQFLFAFGVLAASLPIIFFSRAIAGLSGANIGIAQASIADVSEPKDRAKNFGLIGAAFGIGFIVGPILGTWAAKVTGNAAAPFGLAGILGIANVAFISIFLSETRKKSKIVRSLDFLKAIHNIKTAFKDVDARNVYLASFLYMAGFMFFVSFVAILLISKLSFTQTSVGTFFGVFGVCIVITQLFILRVLTKKYSERSILKYAFISVGLSILMYPLIPRVELIYILIPFTAIPQGLAAANIGALISKSVSSEKQGAALGINSSLLALSGGLIPLLAGVGSGYIGIQTPFIAGAMLIAASWLVLFVFSKNK